MFIETKLSDVIEAESIYTVHYFDYAKDFSFAGEAHEFWELVYIDSGNVTVTANGITHSLTAGEVILHAPNEFHSIRANESFAGVCIITFSTKSPYAKYLTGASLKLSDELKPYIALILKEASKTFAGPLDIVDQKMLIRLADAPFGSEQIIKNALESLLIGIVRKAIHHDEGTREALPKNNIIVSDIMQILENNLYSQISLDELARNLNFSKSYLKSIFKQATGHSIYNTFLQMKISHSKKLLSEGKYSVSQISDMLGFGSVHHFSKTFHKLVGMSPIAYSKSVKRRSLL